MANTEIRTKLGKNGRIVIPAEHRRALVIEAGDEVIVRLEEGGLRISTPGEAVVRAQELVRRYVPEGRDLVGELISERREESARE